MNNAINIDRVLRLKEVTKITGLSKASVYRLIQTNDFPKQFKIGLKAIGWRESAIIDYLDKKSSQNA